MEKKEILSLWVIGLLSSLDHCHCEFVVKIILNMISLVLFCCKLNFVLLYLFSCFVLFLIIDSSVFITYNSGGMDTLRRLHTLNVSHNQLIGCQGLGATPTLQMIDMSHNHLQHVEDLEKLCLLLSLDVSSNNLLNVRIVFFC